MKAVVWIVIIILLIGGVLYIKHRNLSKENQSIESMVGTTDSTSSSANETYDTTQTVTRIKTFDSSNIKSKEDFKNYLVGEWDYETIHEYSTKTEVYTGKLNLKADGTFSKNVVIEITKPLFASTLLRYSGDVSGTWKISDTLNWKEINETCNIDKTFEQTTYSESTYSDAILEVPCDYIDISNFGDVDTDNVFTSIKELTETSLKTKGKNYSGGYSITSTFTKLK